MRQQSRQQFLRCPGRTFREPQRNAARILRNIYGKAAPCARRVRFSFAARLSARTVNPPVPDSISFFARKTG